MRRRASTCNRWEPAQRVTIDPPPRRESLPVALQVAQDLPDRASRPTLSANPHRCARLLRPERRAKNERVSQPSYRTYARERTCGEKAFRRMSGNSNCSLRTQPNVCRDSVSDMIGLNEDLDTPPAPPPSRAPEFAAKIFAEGGWLQAGLNLEHRPQQEQMARAVAAAMHDDQPLLFEAGTGVGKSLAYLLPGIIHAIDQSRQLIVSTHTISLQEQLETSDLPKCRRLFKSEPGLARYADFKSTVLVGKSNYLCTTRLG